MSNHKIIVIDDSMVIRKTVRDMLPDGKFDVVEAKDGLQGIELIRSENPNLIMLDFFLPKKSGWDVYQEIQGDPQLQTIPLLLMSGRKDEVTDKIPEPFEFFAFVEKPFDQKQLIQGIRDAMERARKRSTVVAKMSLPGIPNTQGGGVSEVEIDQMNQRIKNLESEVVQLKKQLSQIVAFIKKKLQ
jgi:DNA-binding response OmpR family regulator